MSEQLLEAAILLGVGMSVVFLFLTLLILGINLIAWYVKKYPEHSQTNKNYNKKILSPTTVKPEIVAAISAAVHAHQNKQP